MVIDLEWRADLNPVNTAQRAERLKVRLAGVIEARDDGDAVPHTHKLT
jgi:hypothetical protein